MLSRIHGMKISIFIWVVDRICLYKNSPYNNSNSIIIQRCSVSWDPCVEYYIYICIYFWIVYIYYIGLVSRHKQTNPCSCTRLSLRSTSLDPALSSKLEVETLHDPALSSKLEVETLHEQICYNELINTKLQRQSCIVCKGVYGPELS